MFPLLLFCILKTCTNNLTLILYVLMAWQKNDMILVYSVKLIFRETGFLYIPFINNHKSRRIKRENP